MHPDVTLIMGGHALWTDEIQKEWNDRISPLFRKGQSCPYANYYRPRPKVDEYNLGSAYFGFTYTVCDHVKGTRDVCQTQWLPSEPSE